MRYLAFFNILLISLTAQVIVPSAKYKTSPYLGSSSRGDGGLAREALLNAPSGIAEDVNGNVYVSEANASVIRRIRPNGIIERFAGTGDRADGRSGHDALKTDIGSPTSLLLDGDGGLIFFDNAYCRIRKVTVDGKIADLAGSGACAGNTGGGGFGGLGNNADKDGRSYETSLGTVGAMVYDSSGRLTWTETSLHILRRLTSDNKVETIAGLRQSSYSGDSGLATQATLSSPIGLAADGEGYLYIGDSGNCRVRRIDPTGYIDTYIGTAACATSGSTYNGSAKTPIERPSSVIYDRNSKSIMIALPRAYRVLRYNINENRLVPIIGNGKAGNAEPVNPLDFPVNDASVLFQSPTQGLLVASPSAYHVYRLQGIQMSVFAGTWPQPDNYPADKPLLLLQPRGILRAHDGSLLVLDTGANRLLRQNTDGTLTALAGTAFPAGFAKGDGGPALEATLDNPVRIAERGNGEIYIAEATKIRVLTPAGILKTARANLNSPSGLLFDSSDRLIYSEAGSHRVMRLNLSTGVATVLAGGKGAGFSGDGAAATAAQLNNPGDLAYDSQGNILIADRGNRRIRKLLTNGNITTVVGNGLPFSYADITGDSSKQTGFAPMEGLAVDSGDNIYISESRRLTRISSDGILTILTGYRSQADDETVTFLNEPLFDADCLLWNPDGTLLYAVRSEGQIKLLSRIQ
ncbi:hypothetical protein [Bryobacter aggregatus]|uniref:NHL domain-containing protein n=1 Tax=Bryobacter aggregatus TaxID=360054 RepID=UPI0004E1E471|nr:hypothetical protein [Bryobacter aggregatus]